MIRVATAFSGGLAAPEFALDDNPKDIVEEVIIKPKKLEVPEPPSKQEYTPDSPDQSSMSDEIDTES